MTTALITGITGQTGSYLAEFLLSRGYGVHGTVRRASTSNRDRIAHIEHRIKLHEADMTDQGSLVRAVRASAPDEVYNLAAQSFVPQSWTEPLHTGDVTAFGVSRILEAIRLGGPSREIRFFQASSSEMFGKVTESPQTESTRFHPRSPYGVAKVYGYWLTVNYRESFGIYACNGICFNHESPRRGLEFVTRKITHSAARIKRGKQSKLKLGNLDAKRDWGHARDTVEAMWLMLQQDAPDDYVISTGETHTIREFAKLAFDCVGLDYREYVETDPDLYRPAEVQLLLGDSSKARERLGWTPKVSFGDLVKEMVEEDMRIVRRGLPPYRVACHGKQARNIYV